MQRSGLLGSADKLVEHLLNRQESEFNTPPSCSQLDVVVVVFYS